MHLPFKITARAITLACVLGAGVLMGGCATTTKSTREMTSSALDAALAGSQRTAADRGRDQYRHPKQTLLFFGIRPGMRVLQVWPESGWYTAIMAPLLHARGRYIAAVIPPDPGSRLVCGFCKTRNASNRPVHSPSGYTFWPGGSCRK